MAKKYVNKLSKSLDKRARSSVGRAPQWHGDEFQKKPADKTLLRFPKNAQVVEIPDGWEPVPAMRYENGHPVLYRVLVKSRPERLENDYNGKRRNKKSA